MTTQTAPERHPAALAYSAENCSVAATLSVLGEKWTFLVIREVVNGIRRFEDMRLRTAIPKQVLTHRLALLVDEGILRKEPYQLPGERARHEYKLTEKGFDLYPVLVAMANWGDQYLTGASGTAAVFTHRDCGEPVHARLICNGGHELGSTRDVVPVPGPGVRRRTGA